MNEDIRQAGKLIAERLRKAVCAAIKRERKKTP